MWHPGQCLLTNPRYDFFVGCSILGSILLLVLKEWSGWVLRERRQKNREVSCQADLEGRTSGRWANYNVASFWHPAFGLASYKLDRKQMI